MQSIDYEHITELQVECGGFGLLTVVVPNGYGVYEISGNKMKNWYYKSVNQDRISNKTLDQIHLEIKKDMSLLMCGMQMKMEDRVV